eukprot:356543-Chlamydomonas_euryale.AAC.9
MAHASAVGIASTSVAGSILALGCAAGSILALGCAAGSIRALGCAAGSTSLQPPAGHTRAGQGPLPRCARR